MNTTTVSVEDAEEYTQSLGQILGGSWRQIHLAERMGVPEALGLTLEEWVQQRLGGYTRLAVSERREAVAELSQDGLSQREIGNVLGVSEATVNRDLKPVTNVTPEPERSPSSQVTPPADSSPVTNVTPEPEFEMAFDSDASDSPDDWTDEPDDEPLIRVAPEGEPVPSNAAPIAHVGRNTGDNEWYTPADYIRAATAVLGVIDLDPASSDAANEVVGAASYYTEDDDGLSQPWEGRLWMNPPYAQPWVDRFCTRMAREYRNGSVTEAIVLVNNGTETNWFQEVAGQATAMCFPRGRIKFWHPSKEATPLQGQAVIYMGPNADKFRAEFLRFGFVVMAHG